MRQAAWIGAAALRDARPARRAIPICSSQPAARGPAARRCATPQEQLKAELKELDELHA